DVINRGLQLYSGAYIFAATRESETATNIPATFTIADHNATSITVVNENRTIPVINGVFTDTFATGATVHIYQVNDGSSVPPPVTINNSFPTGYTLPQGVQKLIIGSTAVIGGSGITTASDDPVDVINLGSVSGSRAAMTLGDGGSITNGSTT